MDRFVRKIIAYVIIIALLISVLTVCAFGSSSDGETEAPTIEPTPIVNEIGSTGDIKVRASYEDNGIFDDNMAINTIDMSESGEIDSVINAVRSIEREQDIFEVMLFSLQINGRDTALTKRINIRVEQTEAFAAYRDVSVFFVNDAGSAEKLDAAAENGCISFTTDALGIFVLTGIGEHGAATPSQEPNSTHSLQTGDNAGIISPSHIADTNEGDISDTISPGAFVFWLFLAIVVGVWLGIGIGYILWGRYKVKRVKTGPKVIGE